MEEVYTVLKGFLDPVFIVFVLLLIAFFVCVAASKKKTGALILLLSIILLYAVSIFPTANFLCHYLEKDYINNSSILEQNTDVIVVLGGGSKDINALKNTFLTEITAVRILHAVEVYNKNGVKYFVCSGKGTGKISEALVMARLAEKLGVPKEKIRIEDKSMNTWQNAAELSKMFANKNISVGIVTSAYHMKRSEREFKKYFNNVSPLVATYFYSSFAGNSVVKYMPQSEDLYKTSIALKEIAGQLWQRLK
ncbi:MAG: YdcF family protein [Smithellaceae bacterium]|jgi:uncharacterized SAM-binding protein YcdF (DUF218 family)